MPATSATPHIVVIGGGHAGVEASCAAARLHAQVTIVTHQLEAIGMMSCNPAIGGIGKGHLVREIDALDGIMGKAADLAGIHYRTLNRSKGPAVRATRAQTDRTLYRGAIRRLLEQYANIHLFQGEVTDLAINNQKVCGVQLRSGTRIDCDAVVLTAGTFLAGKMHTGNVQSSGGRAGGPAAGKLAFALRKLGLPVGRLKTGTPPRLDGRSIDFSQTEIQSSERPRPAFCMLGAPAKRPRQVHCYLTATTPQSHAIVRDSLHLSPVNSGAITGTGPRYCPSIEDKVVRFADRDSHRIFLEPEGLDTHEIYPNGISTALPFEAQVDLVHSIPGLQNARLTRAGYAVEYDYYDPRSLTPDLAVSGIEGLFFAGQINGTTGYEEAAAQGLLAGANAALQALGREPWWPTREQSYLGVMVDDLTTAGVLEPYRMFTSRAEFRLRLREDNADLRLTQIGRELGLVGLKRWQSFCAHRELIDKEMSRLDELRVNEQGRTSGLNSARQSASSWLRRPEAKYTALPDQALRDRRAIAEIEARCKYAGLISRQTSEVLRQQALTDLRLPDDMCLNEIYGLSNEAKEKLLTHKPATLGQASRISGITPAAIALLHMYLAKTRRA